MRLGELLAGLDVAARAVPLDTEITHLCVDSRQVRKGSLFAAVPGSHCDGGLYAKQAADRGAVCILCQSQPLPHLPCVAVQDVRAALAKVAGAWYGHPARKLTVLGVTGTNGKTTVTYLLRHILTSAGVPTGLIGTVQNLIGERALPARRTTPDALEIQGLLAQMACGGCTHAVMEVSSHGLDQHRVDGIDFAVGIFTNLTEDHLDYHGTMERYCAAKAKLFQHCRAAVCNADDPWTPRLLSGVTCPVTRYGLTKPADLWAENLCLEARSVRFTACSARERTGVSLGVPGRFTVYNTLGAMAACGHLGLSQRVCAAALESFPGVKGRMEVVPAPGKPYTILIDYAHTPDALENVLKTVRSFAEKRVIAVFGCGGDREKEKRPVMGQIAAALADLAVITSDNPRREEPIAIIRDILPGLSGGKGKWVVEPDRRAAIALAMAEAAPGDVIVLCGKGHETYQEIGDRMRPMDEREIVRSLL